MSINLPVKSAVILLAFTVGGCASQAARIDETGPRKGDRAAARDLYEGEPAVMHGTEYPVTNAAEGLARGDAAWRKGDLDLAVYLYVQALAYDATSPDPLLRIGAIHERRGNKALAGKAFEMALKLDPDDPAINERLGLLYLHAGQSAAIPLLEHAIAKDPRRWQSHNGLGIAADRNKDFVAAIAHYDAALALEPRATVVVNNRGFSHYLAGDFTGAEADFRLALQMGPLAGTWTNLGRAQARQGRYADALESFLKEHDEARARNLLGEVAMEGGDFDMAQNEFTLAMSASPRYFQAAQDNLDLLAKRIAEQAIPVAPVSASTTAASSLPVGAATAAAGINTWNPNLSYSYGGTQRKRQAGNDSQASTRAASCTGAAAMKPRCNPYAARQPKPYKPYRVASNKQPRS